MNALPFIPPRTRAEIASPAPQGHRHEQMKKVSLPLLAAGLAPEAVFAQLRSMYEEDVTDREIRSVITWFALKNPTCGYPRKKGNVDVRNSPRLATPQQVTTEKAIANAESWLGNFRCDECDLRNVSPWRPLEDWCLDTLMLLAALYDKAECLNVLTDFTIDRQKDGETKSQPQRGGQN